mmetsp:Transcript_53497/g.125238  ORF Transcript_53497/g.125238 Transcript_53497/m.125238 type:complete len:204 (+) Transcript_53497:1888-2499(+)
MLMLPLTITSLPMKVSLRPTKLFTAVPKFMATKTTSLTSMPCLSRLPKVVAGKTAANPSSSVCPMVQLPASMISSLDTRLATATTPSICKITSVALPSRRTPKTAASLAVTDCWKPSIVPCGSSKTSIRKRKLPDKVVPFLALRRSARSRISENSEVLFSALVSIILKDNSISATIILGTSMVKVIVQTSAASCIEVRRRTLV